jgi:hypothetical protein
MALLVSVVSASSVFNHLMAQLKADALPREVMESVLRDRFATWHGVSSILYSDTEYAGAVAGRVEQSRIEVISLEVHCVWS